MNLPPRRRRASSLVRWVVVIAVALGALGVALAVYGSLRPVVTVTETVQAPVVQAFYATGTLSPVRDHPIKASVEGIVERLGDADSGAPLIDKGSRVTKGQPLLKVVDPKLELAATRAKAELDEKRARSDEKTSPVVAEYDARISATLELLELARNEQRRVTQALEHRAATQVDLDRAIDRVKELWKESEGLKAQKASTLLRLRADLEVAESAYKTALWNLGLQTLRSPIDGVILDRPASPGTHLNVNDHVMLIADVRPQNLVMRAQVDEENMTLVRERQEVQMSLYSYPNRLFTGHVAKIYDKADPERRTFEVDVAIDHPDDRMSAGMTGELAFVVASKEAALVVPRQALQGNKLFTVRDGKLTTVEAQIGLSSIERVEVVSGLNPGERVVISPIAGLREGQPVRTQFMDPTAAAGLNKPKPKEIFRGGF
jgi:multidrug efflux pump subunit AcrA (membrane-fusion protein)